ncbi:hypothetical protein OCD85_27395 [Bacillus pacificus]|nr:hypothetical protein [Bacillus pacificus]MCU5364638.1 hypothetical protein [Bacillus pacificus]MCU5402893.1 hypothetical protein [Bacillus pacificus]
MEWFANVDWDAVRFIAPPTLMVVISFFFLFRNLLKEEAEQ